MIWRLLCILSYLKILEWPQKLLRAPRHQLSTEGIPSPQRYKMLLNLLKHFNQMLSKITHYQRSFLTVETKNMHWITLQICRSLSRIVYRMNLSVAVSQNKLPHPDPIALDNEQDHKWATCGRGGKEKHQPTTDPGIDHHNALDHLQRHRWHLTNQRYD